MSENKPSYQIVLLIDEHNSGLTGQFGNTTCNSVRSACLAVLTYFSEQVKNDSKHFQWGFKVYNSSKVLPPHKSAVRKFGDFSLRLFEDFENTLECRFDNQETVDQNEEDKDSVFWQSRTSLRKALQEILFDFQWDAPDIMSPVKRRPFSRSVSNTHLSKLEEHEGKQSLVFIVSRCPISAEDALYFSGGKDSCQAFLKSFLPDSGFQNSSKRVFWLDTSHLWVKQVNEDMHGFNLMNAALKGVQGAVIPVQSLVNSSQSYNSEDLLEPALTEFQMLPASVVISCYMKCHQAKQPETQKATLVVHNDEGIRTLGILDAQCLSRQEQISNQRKMSDANFTITSGSKECHLTPTDKQSQSIGAQGNAGFQLKLIGKMHISQLSLDLVCSEPVYLLTAPPGGELAAWCGLLASLMANSLLLVVEKAAKHAEAVVCFIRPLTPTSSTLTFLSSAETELARRLCILPTSRENPQKLSDLLQKHSVTHPIAKKNCPASSSSYTKKNKFRSEFLEPWFKQQLTASAPVSMNMASHRNSRADEDRMITLLQEKYRQRNNTLPLSQLSLRRSPRKRTPAVVTSDVTGVNKTLTDRDKNDALKDGKSTLKRTRSSTGGVHQARRSREDSNDSVTSRSVMIMKRSREALRQRDSLPEPTQSVRRSPRKHSPKKQLNWRNLVELMDHINKQHEMVTAEKVSPVTWATMAVMETMRFHSKSLSSLQEAQTSTRRLFEEELCLSCEAVREKNHDNSQGIFIECQVQCCLRIELYSQCDGTAWPDTDIESYVTQITSFLRAMTFLKEPAFLSVYLSDTILPQYVNTCGPLLVGLYDEVMQPLPHALLPYASASEDPLPTPHSTWSDSFIDVVPNSVASASVSSKRSVRMKRHASFQTGPVRAIALPCHDKKVSRRGSLPKPPAANSKSARRSLMQESGRSMVRHNSVAVMEGQAGLKTPKRRSSPVKSTAKTPKGHQVLKTKFVTETPAHKQVSKRLWRQQERKRKSSSQHFTPKTSVDESPDKALRNADRNDIKSERSTPGQLRPKLLRHASFYQGARSRSVSNYEETCRLNPSRLLSPKQAPSDKLLDFPSHLSKLTRSSPRRVTTTKLFVSLLQNSPSQKQFGSNYESPLTRASLGNAFDSPSKNTRLQALKARMMTQGETNACKNLTSMFSTPKKKISPEQKASISVGFLSPSSSNKSNTFGVPGALTNSMNPVANSPMKVAAIKSSKKQLFCSPAKRVETKTADSTGTGVRSLEDLMLSPTRVTRSMLQQGSNAEQAACTQLSYPKIEAHLTSPMRASCTALLEDMSVANSRKDPGSNSRSSQPTLEELMASPTRVTRSMVHQPGAEEGETCASKPQPTTPPPQASLIQTTPSNSSRKRSASKSPHISPFDKWRKVKRRFLSPSHDKTQVGSASDVKSISVMNSGADDLVSPSRPDEESAQCKYVNNAAEGKSNLKRRIKTAFRRSKVKTSLASTEFSGLALNTGVGGSASINHADADEAELSLDSAFEMSGGTENSSLPGADEVFFDTKSSSQKPKTNYTPLKSKPKEFLSLNSDTNLEFPSFRSTSHSNLENQSELIINTLGCFVSEENIDSGLETKLSSQSSRSVSPTFTNKVEQCDLSSESGPPSPIFTSPVAARKRKDISPASGKKFSPNISQKSIQHLLESPLLQSPNTRDRRKAAHQDLALTPVRPNKSCRRSLCNQ